MDIDKQQEKSYIDIKKKVVNRLNRIEGQIRGIKKMLEEEQDCSKILEQMSSIRASIDSVGILMVSCSLYSRIHELINAGEPMDYVITETMKPFIKGNCLD